MPIVDGKYEAKLGTTYEVDEGLKELRKQIGKSRAIMVFNIVWLGDRILDISTMEYSTCVKCLRKTFDGAWRYSQKW